MEADDSDGRIVLVFLLVFRKRQLGRNQYGKQQIRLRFEQTSSNFNVHFPVAHAIWESILFRIVTFLISLEQCRMDEPRIKAGKSVVVRANVKPSWKRLVDKYF